MKIIGIDPGSGTIGFGVIERANRGLLLLDAGVIQTRIGDSPSARLKELYDELTTILLENRPQVASVEKLFFAQNVTTAMAVSQARGVILLALEAAGIEIAEYTPLQIKMAIAGYGRATKSQMQEMVRVQLGLKAKPKPDDCADALAAAICHSVSMR